MDALLGLKNSSSNSWSAYCRDLGLNERAPRSTSHSIGIALDDIWDSIPPRSKGVGGSVPFKNIFHEGGGVA